MDDNPYLPDDIKRRYESMYSGVFYDRYIRGEWVVAEGRIYRQFADHPDAFILRGPTAGMDGQFTFSIDYGTSSFSMGLWCVQNKRATRIKEWYYDSRKKKPAEKDEEYYAALETFAQGYYIRKVIVDPSAASFLETIRRHGKFSAWDADNNVLDGIRVTSSLLSAGMIQIHESCKDSIRNSACTAGTKKRILTQCSRKTTMQWTISDTSVIRYWPVNSAGSKWKEVP